MNIILKIILLNLLLIYSLKYNNKLLYLLIVLFGVYMLYTYYYINNVIEGNISLDDYKMNFVGLLNKDIKTSYKEDILYDRILDNFTKLLKLMDKSEGKIPPTQMCRGELGEWSECSRECGRGNKTRRFNVIQKAGENGIKCVYENGQLETSECFERLCKFNEPCEEDFDCLSNYCSKSDKVCSYPHMCERDKLYNCNAEQCANLSAKYGEYEYDVVQHRCVNKFTDLTVNKLSESEEISKEQKDIETTKEDNRIKLKTERLENNIDNICEILIISDDINQCTGASELECNTLYEIDDSKNIPCYYDYNNKECKKITEYYEKDWDNIKKKLNPNGRNKNTIEDYFNCKLSDNENNR
jgi:hypothetical protein